jgi:hypothetical protein
VGVFFFLNVAQLLHAIGQSAVYTLGPAHINANCTLKDAAMLISWIYMIGPLGMAAGFMVIGPMLAGGTWWKCFAFNGTVTLLLVPLYWRLPAVPHKHKETAVLNTVRRPSMMGGPPPLSTSGKVAPSNSEISAQRRPSSLGTITVQEFHVMDFQSQVKSMFTNKVWFLTVVMGSAEVFMVSAISTHGAQYFESYGGITASTATFLAGLIIVPAAAVGTVIGGIMESKRHTSLLASSWWNVKMALLSALFFILSQLLKCDQFDVVGANFDEGTTTTPECSEAGGCDCDQSYYPVCYEGQTYFSPCHAGCTDWITDDASEFMDTVNASLCSCLVVGGNLTADSIVEAGYCEEHQCANLGMILLTFFLLIMFTFMNNTPTNVVLMRCVPTEYSGLSLALNDIVDKLLGDIPGGIILGWFLDQSCKVKNYLTDPLTCDTLESCAIFDKAGMKFRVNILNGLLPKGLSFLFAYLAYKAICADPEMQKPYEASTTKTGNFRRASKLSVDLPSMKEEEEEEGEEEA